MCVCSETKHRHIWKSTLRGSASRASSISVKFEFGHLACEPPCHTEVAAKKSSGLWKTTQASRDDTSQNHWSRVAWPGPAISSIFFSIFSYSSIHLRTKRKRDAMLMILAATVMMVTVQSQDLQHQLQSWLVQVFRWSIT